MQSTLRLTLAAAVACGFAGAMAVSVQAQTRLVPQPDPY